jgi:hypothetical protein
MPTRIKSLVDTVIIEISQPDMDLDLGTIVVPGAALNTAVKPGECVIVEDKNGDKVPLRVVLPVVTKINDAAEIWLNLNLDPQARTRSSVAESLFTDGDQDQFVTILFVLLDPKALGDQNPPAGETSLVEPVFDAENVEVLDVDEDLDPPGPDGDDDLEPSLVGSEPTDPTFPGAEATDPAFQGHKTDEVPGSSPYGPSDD